MSQHILCSRSALRYVCEVEVEENMDSRRPMNRNINRGDEPFLITGSLLVVVNG